jgi:hypothetical protein
MAAPKFIDIDGRRFLWRRELLRLRREPIGGGGKNRAARFVRVEGGLPARVPAHRRRALQRAQPVRPARAGGLTPARGGIRQWNSLPFP